MPTTEPVYGWPLPLDTDPLSAGAKAIRDLGTAISATDRAIVWCTARPNADQTLGADGWSQVALADETDPYNIFAGNAATLPHVGLVSVSWNVTVSLSGAAPGAVNISSAIYLNGAEVARGSSFASSSSPSLQQFGSAGTAKWQATAGHLLTLWTFVTVPGTTKKVLVSGTRLELNYCEPKRL